MSHHHPFKSLGPLSWATDIAPHTTSTKDDTDNTTALTSLFTSTLTNAQLLIDSIPPSTSSPTTPATTRPSTPPGRARSHTDSAVSPPSGTTTTTATKHDTTKHADDNERHATLTKLSREWKDLKMQQGGGSSNGNPHGIAMYKMGAKDGRGAWFARRSFHRVGPGGVGFERWEAALRREMQVTLERVEAEPRKEPGTGNVRGIGAERKVDGVEFEGGKMGVYHVSARFPGPTTPRDFITLIMTPKEEKKPRGRKRAPRQFMVVSRPCDHPDCPPRPGFVRGTYESVEVIREVPVEKPLRRVRSSVDLSRDDANSAAVTGEPISKEAVLRAAKQAVGEEAESEGEGAKTVSFRLSDDADSDMEMAIEWLMVTRSDPGGSVPRFMVEKGTPGGIINDAGKFVKWLSSQSMEELMNPRPTMEKGREKGTKPTGESPVNEGPGRLPADTAAEDQLPDGEAGYQEGPSANNSGIYGMLSSALGMATSAVASRVAAFTPASIETDSDISDYESDNSDGSFASAEDGPTTQVDTSLSSKDDNSNKVDTTPAAENASNHSTHSLLSETTSQALSREQTPSAGLSQAQAQHEKELRKLQQRMHKAQEKLERAKARRLAKQNNNNNNNSNNSNSNGATTTDPDTDSKTKQEQQQQDQDDQALTRLHEKHAREVARQEAKYQRELQRLAEKRAAEERKTAERRRKAAEREERGNLAMELGRARAERDVARKEVEMLRERVGELQGQNTRLVARLGREGVGLEGLGELL
ncbi:uncharacterized protein B0H64DRAFT_460264 [Chaetomium fimeti]|uniref:DUF3074 domain-containing protein n=1 Tax=Chaetomium fimeti TaxID=1854472 RepID=A0AAE0HFX7_9PEZI|nr:hypothetical protein B0H64DRAFT_460264 [Chaetomium fimeti]